MSMSTRVIGIKPPDDNWKAHKAVWDACHTANVEVPKQTSAFFNHAAPDESGVVVEMDVLQKCGAATEYSDSDEEGIEVDLTKLPPDIKIIRFTNSW